MLKGNVVKIESRKPVAKFDLGQAITMMFQTPDGKAFAWRLLFWTTAGIAITLLVTLPFIIPHYGPLLEFNYQNMQAAMEGSTPPDPAGLLNAFMKMLPAFLVMMAGFWVSYAAGEAALHRKVLLNSENQRRPVRFGREELLVMLAQLGVWSMFFAVYVGGIVMTVIGAAIPVIGIILAVVGIFAMLALFIIVPVRLAPAAALSVAKSKAHLLAARHITKYRFWPLLGAYVIVFIGGYIATYLVSTLGIMLVTGDSEFMLALMGLGSESPEQAYEQAANRLKNPVFMILGVLSIILYAAAYAAYMLSVAGVGSYAVHWWRSDNPADKFE